MRLIDADKLADYICDACGDDNCDRSPSAHCVERDFAVRVAKDAPTIGAEPVRHGKWIISKLDGIRIETCSLCGWFEEYIVVRPRYCPWCGARMDAE